MNGNTFGHTLKLTTFGESHGEAVGAVLDGFPANISINLERIKQELERRRSAYSFQPLKRYEEDEIRILSGIVDGKTLGTPISFIIENKDANPADYEYLKDIYRPSHADFTYDKKHGIYDMRGGGRASARETVARVGAGAFAKIFLEQNGIRIFAYTKQIGHLKCSKNYKAFNQAIVESSMLRCPDEALTQEMIELLEQLTMDGNSIGGIVCCVIENCPVGLGEPVFDKLQAVLSHAMMSIPAAKGFQYGEGFGAANMTGFDHNDVFSPKMEPVTNHAGGILGGISTGEDIFFEVAFKPIATIEKEQFTANKSGKTTSLKNRGRHDVCAVPRAVPIVEAMAALVIADMILRS